MRGLFFVALLIGSPASAQCFQNGVECSIADMQNTLSNVQANMPVPANTVPPPEVVGGAAGSQMTFRRGDSVQPRITRVRPWTTGADGTATVTYQDIGTTDLGAIVTMNLSASSTLTPSCGVDFTALGRTSAKIVCKINVLNLGVLNLNPGTSVSGSITVLPNTPAS